MRIARKFSIKENEHCWTSWYKEVKIEIFSLGIAAIALLKIQISETLLKILQFYLIDIFRFIESNAVFDRSKQYSVIPNPKNWN